MIQFPKVTSLILTECMVTGMFKPGEKEMLSWNITVSKDIFNKICQGRYYINKSRMLVHSRFVTCSVTMVFHEIVSRIF